MNSLGEPYWEHPYRIEEHGPSWIANCKPHEEFLELLTVDYTIGKTKVGHEDLIEENLEKSTSCRGLEGSNRRIPHIKNFNYCQANCIQDLRNKHAQEAQN